MVKVWVGIDPGKTGALAILIEGMDKDGGISAEVWDFEEVLDGIGRLGFLNGIYPCHALIEKQQSFHKQGVVSSFKLGENYGWWQGILQGIEVAYEIVTPAKWKKEMFDGMPRSEDKKAMSLGLARRLFPKMKDTLKRKKDHDRAEALLLAELMRRKGR